MCSKECKSAAMERDIALQLCKAAQEWTNHTLAVHERSDSLLFSICR